MACILLMQNEVYLLLFLMLFFNKRKSKITKGHTNYRSENVLVFMR
jgi:hypothetical protein